MSEEQRGLDSISVAIARTDWTRYAGQASSVKRRGELRRRRFQAGAALGTTLAVVGVAVAMRGSSVPQQGAAPATSPSRILATPTASPGTPDGAARSANYPSFPAELPTTPKLVANPGKVLSSGVIGAGTVGSHTWQISYRVIPSGSPANSQPQVNMVDISLDGKTVTAGGGEGVVLGGAGGYQAMDQYFQNSGLVNPMVVVTGSPSPGAASVDLRWTNGTVVQVPIRTVDGGRFAPFAFDPANPPEAVEQVGAAGVSAIRISRDGMAFWGYDPDQKSPFTPAAPPSVVTPTGAPNLSQTPHVTPHSSAILGQGTVAGHPWQLAYEIIPSGSAANVSDEAFCTDTTVDGTTVQGGCSSSKPFGDALFSFADMGGHGQFPIVVSFGNGVPGTTALGLEWADGTMTVNAAQTVEGTPMAALAFDPANPPEYLVEFGSYGAYRMPLGGGVRRYTWTFDWP
jgi:hypothetical protein